MFNVDGDVLNPTMDLALDDVGTLEGFIKPRLEYIEEIGFEGDEALATSSLIQLLVSIKKAKPEIKIPLLEASGYDAKQFGTMHWRS